MAGFQNLIGSLRRAQAQLEKQIDGIRNAIASLTGVGAGLGGAKRGRPAGKRGPGRPKGGGKKRGRRKMSAAARARISAAQKKRWAEKRAKEKK